MGRRVTRHSEDRRLTSTLRLAEREEQAEATGTIQIQRLLAWYYATEAASRRAAASREPGPSGPA